jgi:probable phosphoglycerate mutase
MLTIHLVRHGETAQAAEGVFCGDLNPPLTERGLFEAERVGRAAAALKPVALYCSPKLRAQQTIAPLAQATGLAPIVEEGLREIAYGRWEGRKESEIRSSEPELYAAWHDDPAMASPPGGETAFDIAGRALPVLSRVRERHQAGHVVIVSHKATVRILACALLGMPLQRFRTHVACPTASFTSFEIGHAGALLVRVADVHHLE